MTEPEREIEVKLLDVNQAALEQQLVAHGAHFDVEEHQTNVRLDSSASPLPLEEYLRLRTVAVEGQEAIHELTLKRRVSQVGARVNEEYTVHVDDPEKAILLLAQLGYVVKSTALKRRRRYLWEDFRVEFDAWDPAVLPLSYVEVEAPSEGALDRFLSCFDIPRDHVSTLSIAELSARLERA